jgi:hypothetical protein
MRRISRRWYRRRVPGTAIQSLGRAKTVLGLTPFINPTIEDL